MQSIDDKIVCYIQKCGRGKMIFVSDFVRYGESRAVNKALERLVLSEIIIRVAKGIYFYPKIDKSFGLGVLYPSLETIAEAIAKRDKAKIIPAGAYALNRLGLSEQVPMNLVFLTDGSPRNIKIGNGKGIKFIRTAPKNLAYKNRLVMLIVIALKQITEKKVTDEHIDHIKQLLQNESKESVMNDLALMPQWIRTIIRNCYE
ncbi:MAG: hypothetical protein H6Q14_408 [Bacteroidetes bacterium]|nr:hypothetical protein [Bacteroidota bacterium]